MEVCSCIGAGRTTMAKTGCRNNCAQDADAIAHGMRKRMGAGPAPAAWGSTPASGQGQQVCQKRRIDTIVLGMETQLRMGRNQMEAEHLGRTTALHRAGQKLCQQQVPDTTVLRMQKQLRMGCATGWGQSTCDVQRHRGKAKTMPTAGSRYNRAPDADAIAHGMRNHAGAGPTPTAWRCTAALGQGEQLCQKWAVETTVPRMQMQVRMGCATA